MNSSKAATTQSLRISINEAAPCEVAYVSEGEQTYAKVKQEDFERILLERRSAMVLGKVWMGLCLVASVTLAGITYWFTEHPKTEVLVVSPNTVK